MDFTQPQDSLSLLQLKKYVAEGVKPRVSVYLSGWMERADEGSNKSLRMFIGIARRCRRS